MVLTAPRRPQLTSLYGTGRLRELPALTVGHLQGLRDTQLPSTRPAAAQATQLVTGWRGRGSCGRASDPPSCPAPPGARLAKRKLLRPPLPEPQSRLAWGRLLPSRAPSPALSSSNPVLQLHDPQLCVFRGGGQRGQVVDLP